MLFVRLVRAVWVFGLIFNSYVFWLMVRKIFRRWRKDEQGRDVPRDPGWVHAYKSRIDRLNALQLAVRLGPLVRGGSN